ncbi:MAG TPA: PD-(D/E)XK nuclease family protein, partial [bacterium]|nr:PD-(D/E)XK nuclease family protein [bacterium]
FDEFLITVPPDGPSPRLFRRVFAAADVPLADRAGIPALRTEDGRRAMALARAVSARRDDRFREALDFLPQPPRDPDREDGDLFDDPFTRFTRARDWAEAVRRFHDLFRERFGSPVGAEVESALAALAAVHGARPNRPRDFARALGAAVAGLRNRTPMTDADGGARVLLVRMDQARGLVRPVVFHAGLAEGALRRLPREDPLLPDRLRETLNERFESEGLRLRRREEARVERVLLARFAFECAGERAVLSWSRRRRTGSEERHPSGLLLDLAAARNSGDPAAALPTEPPDAARANPVDRIDDDLAWLGGQEPPVEEALSRLIGQERARDLPQVLRATEGRWRGGVLTRWDGVLRDPRVLRRVRARIGGERRAWSPTALEGACNCPFSYLVERVLRLGPPEEQESDFDPGTRGRLFHELLETVYVRLLRDDLLPLRAEHVEGAVRMLDDLVGELRAAVRREPPGRRAERIATLAAMRDDLAVAIALDAARSAEYGTVPERFEYEFGLRDAASAPRVDLGDGVAFRVRGRADRVDRRADGSLEVVDVKTGRPRVAAGKIARTEAGRTTVALQLPLYLAAVSGALGERVACAEFWHATAEHGYRRIPFTAADLEEARPGLARLLAHVAERSAAGWFPSLPGDECCRRSLGPACGPAAAARFLRKASDPDVRARLRLLNDTDPGRRT